MTPTYKLTYFDVMGRGEPIRYLLSYGGAEFEDVRIPKDQWPALKSSAPFGQLPILEVDGKRINQSVAICRYLAKQFGLYGENEWETLNIDATIDTIEDILKEMKKALTADDEEKTQKRETLLNETLPFYLTRLDKQVVDNGNHFVHGKLTLADIYFTALMDGLSDVIGSELVEEYEHLNGLMERVYDLPNIEAWRAKRPKPV